MAKPFLKWAGGKSRLLKQLLVNLPPRYSRYIEPFIGGGALYFAVQPKSGILGDANSELINVYQVIKTKPDELIAELKKHIYEKEYYLKIRALDREPTFSDRPDYERAARFIYLNKTCFNGLYRVNRQGFNNVPFGRYVNPTICDEANLWECSKSLQGAELLIGDYVRFLDLVQPDDFIYLDPPYVPISKTASFTAYHQNKFGEAEQVQLAEFCEKLNQKKVKFLLSNSYSPLVLSLYQGFNIQIVSAPRAISADGAKREAVSEVLVKNY